MIDKEKKNPKIILRKRAVLIRNMTTWTPKVSPQSKKFSHHVTTDASEFLPIVQYKHETFMYN